MQESASVGLDASHSVQPAQLFVKLPLADTEGSVCAVPILPMPEDALVLWQLGTGSYAVTHACEHKVRDTSARTHTEEHGSP
jgi:hypothetical protein